jgi:hypothetical protein
MNSDFYLVKANHFPKLAILMRESYFSCSSMSTSASIGLYGEMVRVKLRFLMSSASKSFFSAKSFLIVLYVSVNLSRSSSNEYRS